MNKPRKLAALALGLSLGLAGFGPVALAQRNGDHDHDAEAATSCTTSMSNDSDNSTGASSQSGLININNIGVQGNNLDVLGNLLCQGVFLNDVVAGVLGFARGGGGGGGHGDANGCSTSMDNETENSTGDSEQNGLINANNVAVQGNNIGVGGNALCGGNLLNNLVAGVLGTAIGGGGGDRDHDRNHDDDGGDSCSTDMSTDADSETGDSMQNGQVLNVNNVAVQGNNIDALGNALCTGNFLNGLTGGVLGTALNFNRADRDNDRDHGGSSCSTDMDNGSENSTGDSLLGGLLNLNNLAVQGNNVEVLGNGLCGGVFLNDLLVSVLSIVG